MWFSWELGGRSLKKPRLKKKKIAQQVAVFGDAVGTWDRDLLQEVSHRDWSSGYIILAPCHLTVSCLEYSKGSPQPYFPSAISCPELMVQSHLKKPSENMNQSQSLLPRVLCAGYFGYSDKELISTERKRMAHSGGSWPRQTATVQGLGILAQPSIKTYDSVPCHKMLQ